MTTTTLSHTGSTHASPHAVQVVRAFLTAWFKATPVHIVYSALTH
ncbi:hypothetical protein [Azospirillum sp. sgz302134]